LMSRKELLIETGGRAGVLRICCFSKTLGINQLVS